ncbi:hypothetical protein [Allorhizocola rhizosphaerae]|uniref:hypothetical protein n=1 Tax=Allorhizocola rhizosphaerae TaxID=1872709 RepID=UPI000E3ED9BC|nr:hypothetical protein [Allorhizocola rhizosphaerae]
MSLFRKRTLPMLTTDLIEALREQDNRAFSAAQREIVKRAERADAAELTAALHELERALQTVPLGMGGQLATLAAGFVEYGGDPLVALETLALRGSDGLERAARFPALWQAVGEGAPLPEPDDHERIPAVQAELGSNEEHELAEAWFSVGEWIPSLLLPLQQAKGRKALPHRARLTAAAEAAQEHIGEVGWLYGLLRVLDDEPVIVLHPDSGRGFRLTIGGIGDNFQLHTLLAATLIGDPAQGKIPGEPIPPEWVAAATTGEDLEPSGGIGGRFNLVDAGGKWIWNEGRPADIPRLDGYRIVVLEKPPYERTWNAGRVYPLMPPSVTVDAHLTPAEVSDWLAKIGK